MFFNFFQKTIDLDVDLRLLILTDLHTLREDELEKIVDLDYDVCFLLGDITVDYLCEIKKYVNKKVYGILGNHDNFDNLARAGIENINNKIIDINGIKILGFEGSHRYKKGNFPMLSQEESLELLKNSPKADILVSHDAPYYLYSKNMAHCGLKGISKYLLKNKVPINIHGHHHINSVLKLKNGTTVIGVYRCAILDIKNKKRRLIF